MPRAILASPDLSLVSAVSRSAAGRDLGIAWGGKAIGIPVMDSVTKAVRHAAALVDYTSHEDVRANVLAAIQGGVAAGNFSITAAIAQAASLLVAPYLPHGEVIDYASAAKWSSESRRGDLTASRVCSGSGIGCPVSWAGVS